MVVFIPTVAMLFLIPVFVLGSISEKIVAFVVFLPHACIGFAGWEQAVYLFRDSASRGN